MKTFGMAALALAVGLGVAGCSDGYGYSGVSVGYAAGNYGPYDDYGYDYAGYGYGAPSYFGWYGDFYYPGSGIYVYDRYRRPYRWNDGQRRYWESQRHGYHGGRAATNWNGFGRGEVTGDRRGYRGDTAGRGAVGTDTRAGFAGRGYRGGRPDVAVAGQPGAVVSAQGMAARPEGYRGGGNGYRGYRSSAATGAATATVGQQGRGNGGGGRGGWHGRGRN